MGTNYYLADGRHVGKQSAGWRFLAQAETAPSWYTLQSLLLSEPIVVDEYDEHHSSMFLIGQIERHTNLKRHVATGGEGWGDVIYSDGPTDFYRGEFS